MPRRERTRRGHRCLQTFTARNRQGRDLDPLMETGQNVIRGSLPGFAPLAGAPAHPLAIPRRRCRNPNEHRNALRALGQSACRHLCPPLRRVVDERVNALRRHELEKGQHAPVNGGVPLVAVCEALGEPFPPTRPCQNHPVAARLTEPDRFLHKLPPRKTQTIFTHFLKKSNKIRLFLSQDFYQSKLERKLGDECIIHVAVALEEHDECV